MKISFKLSVILLLVTCLIFGVGGYLIVKREIRFFEEGATRDKIIYGRPLAAAVEEIWRHSGETAALYIVAVANARQSTVGVRWMWPDSPDGSSTRLILATEHIAALESGEIVQGLRAPEDNHLYTYIPVRTPGGRVGALELRDNLADERMFARETVLLLVSVFAVMAVVAAGMTLVLGLWMVGHPVQVLVEKARRTASGDFSTPVELRRRDEFYEIADEMNSMCERLDAAHKRVEAETEARITALQQLRHVERLATVGKLAAGVAHELGTPLNVVSGRAHLLGGDDLETDEIGTHARIIGEQCHRMTDIIRQLLDFARRRGPTTSVVPVDELLRSTVELLDPLAKKRRVELQIDPVQAELIVNGNSSQLQQVLTNIVTNGIHATQDGGTVELRAGEDQATKPSSLGGGSARGVFLEVRDQGAGIPEEDLERVFEPFFTTKDVGQGTGLGLSVAYGIVQDHGGWIDVSSQVGRGSVFKIWLPKS